MPRNFPGWRPRVPVGKLDFRMPSPIYPRNRLDERLEKEVAELRLFAVHGSTGGTKKHVNEAPLRSFAHRFVKEYWLKWQKKKRTNFEGFWLSEAPRIYRELKRLERLNKIPCGAAKLLRHGKRGKFVKARAMAGNLSKL